MGTACSSQEPQTGNNEETKESEEERRQKKRKDKQIAHFMTEQQLIEKRRKKLLLLGSGSAGKSTLFKKLRSIKFGAFPDEVRMEAQPVIRRNIVESILILIKETQLIQERINNLSKQQNVDSEDDNDNNDNNNDNNERNNTDAKPKEEYKEDNRNRKKSKSKSRNENEENENNRELILRKQMLLREEFQDCTLEMTPELEGIVKFLLDVVNMDDFADIDDESLMAVSQSILTFWQLAAIRNMYRKRGTLFSIPDNMDYFLNKTEIVMAPGYIPDEQDHLKARARTVGVTNYEYDHGDHKFHIYDVGGQRSERSKWIHQFENVHALIFVVALNHYNAVLFEDNKVNAMLESVDLFEDLINEKWFRRSEVILLLNKDDLFRQKLRVDNIPLSICFSKDGGWPNEDEYWIYPHFEDNPNLPQEQNDENFNAYHNDAIVFIEEIYKKRNKNPKKMIYRHVTIATEQKHVEKVFWDVQNIVVRGNMAHAGLLSADSSMNTKQDESRKSKKLSIESKLTYVTTMEQHIENNKNNKNNSGKNTLPVIRTTQNKAVVVPSVTDDEPHTPHTTEMDNENNYNENENENENETDIDNNNNYSSGNIINEKQSLDVSGNKTLGSDHLPVDSTTVSVDKAGLEHEEIPHES